MSDTTLKQCCTHLIRIPSAQTTVSESLNVSISAAIILSHITLLEKKNLHGTMTIFLLFTIFLGVLSQHKPTGSGEESRDIFTT